MVIRTIREDDENAEPYSEHEDWFQSSIEDKLERLKEKQNEIITEVNKLATKISGRED